ncbi:MAG TPA: transporter substrate-binding domain-containing protein [Devosia sp.]|nr:transporter substrate-binding domain-containing protein [Devosia sp.]
MKSMLFAAAAILALSGAAQAQDTVRIATEGAYAPWNFLDDAGKPAGYEIDLANAICAQAKITCEIVTNDWDSIIPNLIAGNYDVIMAGMSVTDERKQTVDFADEYKPVDPSNYASLPGTTLDVNAMSGKRIGAQSGTIQEAYAQEHFAADNTVVAFNTADQAMADLNAGNLDVVLADGAYLDPIVAAGAAVFVGEPVLIGGGIAPALRKDEPALMQTFNTALDALKTDGTVDTLIAKWFDGAGPYYKK